VISGSAICRPSNVTDRLLYFKSINSVSKGKSSREVSSGAEESEAVLSSEVSSDETASIPPADDSSGCIVCLRSANRSVVVSSASTMTTAAAYGGGGAGDRMKNRPQRCRAAFPAQAGGDVRRFSTSRKFFCVSYRFSFSPNGRQSYEGKPAVKILPSARYTNNREAVSVGPHALSHHSARSFFIARW